MGRKNSGNQVAAVASSFEPSALVATADSASAAQPSQSPPWPTAGMTDGKSINELLGSEAKAAEPTPADAEAFDAGGIVVAVDRLHDSIYGELILRDVRLSVPLAARSGGYESSRIEIYGLTEGQSKALDRVTIALRGANARCQKRVARTPDGVVVDTPADAIRWILDQIATESISYGDDEAKEGF